MKDDILADIEWFLGAKKWYKDRGVPYRRGMRVSAPQMRRDRPHAYVFIDWSSLVGLCQGSCCTARYGCRWHNHATSVLTRLFCVARMM